MKYVFITLVALWSCVYTSRAQEMVIDSINADKFYGVIRDGQEGQFLFVPYFTNNKTDKKNFHIRQYNNMSLMEESHLALELPGEYELKAAATDGAAFLLVFHDGEKKEDVLMIVRDGNIEKKKSLKGGANYKAMSTQFPEQFVLITVGNKGAYTVEMLDMSLESKWKKTYAPPKDAVWDIIDVSSTMENIQVTRKETAGGKYTFVLQGLQPDAGEEVFSKELAIENEHVYPTFFSIREGIGYTGGYYFKNSTYNPKPDGIFFAAANPEGEFIQVAQVPYSQVIEDLKATLGNKLTENNTMIFFNGGSMAHESQSMLLAGQVVSMESKEGGTTFRTGDIIILNFSFEMKYKGAYVVHVKPQQATIKGDISKTNLPELARWMDKASFMSFKSFLNWPGNPIIANYERGGEQLPKVCYTPVVITADTVGPACFEAARFPHKEPVYTYTGGSYPAVPASRFGMLSSMHDITKVMVYQLNGQTLMMWAVPMPPLETLRIPYVPEEPAHEEHHEPESPEEEE